MRIAVSSSIRRDIPSLVRQKVNGYWDINLIKISQGGKATVEQILASDEMNKSKRAGLSESQSGILVGKLTSCIKSFKIETL